MQVHVKRVSGMPHNVKIWRDQQPTKIILYVDDELDADEARALIAEALNAACPSGAGGGTAERRSILYGVAG